VEEEEEEDDDDDDDDVFVNLSKSEIRRVTFFGLHSSTPMPQ